MEAKERMQQRAVDLAASLLARILWVRAVTPGGFCRSPRFGEWQNTLVEILNEGWKNTLVVPAPTCPNRLGGWHSNEAKELASLLGDFNLREEVIINLQREMEEHDDPTQW